MAGRYLVLPEVRRSVAVISGRHAPAAATRRCPIAAFVYAAAGYSISKCRPVTSVTGRHPICCSVLRGRWTSQCVEKKYWFHHFVSSFFSYHYVLVILISPDDLS
jgi:hypothetical protein